MTDKDVSMHEHCNLSAECREILGNIDEKLDRIEVKVDRINGTVKDHSTRFAVLEEREKNQEKVEESRKWFRRAVGGAAITALVLVLIKIIMEYGKP